MTKEKTDWKIWIFIACLFLLIVGMITYLTIDDNGKNFKEDSLVLLWLLILFYVIYESIYLYKGKSLSEPLKQKISFQDFLWDNLVIGLGVVITTLGLMCLKRIVSNIKNIPNLLYNLVIGILRGAYNLLATLLEFVFKNKWIAILIFIIIVTLIVKYLLYLIFRLRQEVGKIK